MSKDKAITVELDPELDAIFNDWIQANEISKKEAVTTALEMLLNEQCPNPISVLN